MRNPGLLFSAIYSIDEVLPLYAVCVYVFVYLLDANIAILKTHLVETTRRVVSSPSGRI